MSIYDDHAKRFLKDCGIRITGKYKGRYVPLWDKEPHSTWEIVLRREDRQKGERHAIFITFYQSHADKYKTPTAYDVLACLCKSDCGAYRDFCEDMGLPEYDEETGNAICFPIACTRAHVMNMRNLKPSSPARVNGKSWKRFIEP